MLLVGPSLVFLFERRFPPRGMTRRILASVVATNLALVAWAVGWSALVGWLTYLLIQPLILPGPAEEEVWLNGELDDVLELLRPLDPDRMDLAPANPALDKLGGTREGPELPVAPARFESSAALTRASCPPRVLTRRFGVAIPAHGTAVPQGNRLVIPGSSLGTRGIEGRPPP